jgi:two-component sensor histidine kinase
MATTEPAAADITQWSRQNSTQPPTAYAGLACEATCEKIGEARREFGAFEYAQAQLAAAAAADQQAIEDQRQQILHIRLLGQEADHRLLNGLQLVASLLAMQARKTSSAEAAFELQVAARRVATIGNLHRRLHGMDDVAVVDLTEYLESVCHEVVEMLAFEGRAGAISFSGTALQTPRAVAIPLGFICAELLTNAAKYAHGDIAVTLEKVGEDRYALSVTDQGPGLPKGFDPSAAKGLGMKIILSLVKDVAGELVLGPGKGGRGARFSVLFPFAYQGPDGGGVR